MKIALINPPITFRERYGVSSPAGGNSPPNGLLSIAAVLREKGYQVKIFDGERAGISPGELSLQVAEYNPDVVGITAVTMSVTRAHETVLKIKEVMPNITTVLGGPHVTAVPFDTFNQFSAFDIGVIGEGEETALELFGLFEPGKKSRAFEKINGLLLREGSRVYLTKPRKFIKDLNSLPFPAWDLLDDLTKNYSPAVHTTFNYPVAMVVSSRGCSAKCTFCDQKVFGNNLRAFSASYVFDMVSYLSRTYGVREIHFNDDNFVVFRKRLLEMCDLFSNLDPKLTWTCLGRADQVNEKILEKMRGAGCMQIDFGIETGSQKLLDMSLKGVTLEQLKKSVEQCRAAGINAKGNFMVGFPGETRETLKMSQKFLLDLPLNDFHVTFYTPHPGSESYKTASSYGDLTGDLSDFTTWKPIFIPFGLTRNDLAKASKKMFRTFYFRPRIIWGYIIRIRSLKHLNHYLKGLFGLLEWLLKR